MTRIEMRATSANIQQAIQQAFALHQAGNFSAAEQRYRELLAAVPDDAGVLHLLGLALFQQGKSGDGIEWIRRAIGINPREALFHFNLGILLGAAGDNRAAEQSFRLALALKPGYLEAVENLAHLLENQGRIAEAAAQYQEALGFSDNAANPLLHAKLAMLLQKQDKLEEAENCYARALALQPEAVEIRHQFAYLLHLQGRLEQAEQNYRLVLSAKPDHAAAHMCLGRALAALGRADEALQHCERAVALAPQQADTHRHLGAVLYQLVRLQQAADAYRHALALRPDDATIRHMLNTVENVTPEQASLDYVRAVFDEYAVRFEQNLQQDLRYGVPRRIRQLLEQYLPGQKFDRLLDIGCGTGLGGVSLRDVAQRMIGVDISEKMLEQAARKQVYDELVAGDLAGHLRQTPAASFDLLLSADVFIYVGEITPVFAEALRVLRAGGVFAYSTETGEQIGERGYRLDISGRYIHDGDYLRKLGEQHGFRELHCSLEAIRYNLGKPVAGHIVLLQKP